MNDLNVSGVILMISKDELEALVKESVRQTIIELREIDKEEPLLRIKDAAKRFSVSNQTVHAWCRKGLITKHKINGISLIDVNEIKQALQQVRPYQKVKLN